MQIIRLVVPGQVDRVIGFENLPERFYEGLDMVPVSQYRFPKYWEKYSAVHYILEFTMVNRDKERWQAITNYVKKMVPPETRLMDKLEDMAIPMAPDSKSPLNIEPDDIPVIQLPPEVALVASIPQPVQAETPPPAPLNDKEPEKPVRWAHVCSSRGRGKLAPIGECPRCDQLRNEKKDLVNA